MSKTIDKDTGLPFPLFPTEAMSSDLEAFRNKECQHNQQSPCEWKDGAGNKHIKKQCQQCGRMLGTALRKNKVSESVLVNYQPNLEESYDAKRNAERDDIIQKHIRIQKAQSGEFSKSYKDHLNSDKWKLVIRPKVFKRANGICEGCLERPATQVHHLTYEHLGDEFMFELAAMCGPCHERLHPKDLTSEEVEQEIKRLDCQCRWGDGDLVNPQCLRFCVSVSEAIATDEMCGPDRNEHEGYK
jgi:hypothetical protein